jgi:hypothetical protein
LAHALLAVAAALLVLQACFAFVDSPLSASETEWVRTTSPGWHDLLLAGFRAGSMFLPRQLMTGIYAVALHNRDGHPASLLGQYSTYGWWYYFPVAFALKTSLPMLLLSIAASLWAGWRLLAKRELRYLWLLGPVALYLGVALSSHNQIGIRHLLPIFPFLAMAGGVLLDQVWQARARPWPGMAVVAAILAWTGAEAARAFPNYVPYMNQLASEHPHWWYLSDSNVEFGGGLLPLANYLHEHGESSVYGALSGGWALSLYGIRYHELWWQPGPGEVEPRHYVAIGASFLNGSTSNPPPDPQGRPLPESQRLDYYASYRQRKPVAVFGGSIYLYREDRP